MRAFLVHFGALLGLMAIPALAFAQFWSVDRAHSTLTFVPVGQPTAHPWRFRRFDARIVYDPRNAALSKFDVVIDIASLETGSSARTREALKPRFLDAAKFPRAYFATMLVGEVATGQSAAEGMLKLKGVIRPIALALDFGRDRNGATLDITAYLKPVDFGVGSAGSDAAGMAEGVSVHVHLLLHSKP